VIYIDRFGNGITNLDAKQVRGFSEKTSGMNNKSS